MRRWMLDRLVMAPTTHSIETGARKRELLKTSHGDVELWMDHHLQGQANVDHPADILMIKFPGTGGRAERATAQPAQFWKTPKTELWSVNPPGYGGAKGRASLHAIEPMVDAILNRLQQQPVPKIILVANSLGNLPALCLASRFPVAGLVLRNPPPIPAVVQHRSRRYRAAWIGKWLAGGFPPEIDPVTHAARCTAPAVFIHSEMDQLVPLEFQKPIAAAYAGPKRIIVARGIDHADPIPDEQVCEYEEASKWLEQESLGHCKGTPFT
jgi:hypothetical protein